MTFQGMSDLGHEQVVFCRNDAVGLRAIIGIHDTTLGPALGGLRLYPYASEEDALTDVLRLSRGMTYKAAVSGLDLGGGKAVIIGDPSIKSEGLFRAFGRFVESLGGRYITAEDMNTSVADMSYIERETQWVTGSSPHTGGAGDPSPVTAWGVFHGIRACLKRHFGSADPRGRKVSIQGVGNVGYYLASYLHEAGAELTYTDISAERLGRVTREFGGEVVEGNAWYDQEVDVLAPCAIGGILSSSTIPRLRAPIIAGGANNVLAEEEADAAALGERGILYAPDYVINAGGLMHVYGEFKSLPTPLAMEQAAGIFDTLGQVFDQAESEGISSIAASNLVAEARIEEVAQLQRLRILG